MRACAKLCQQGAGGRLTDNQKTARQTHRQTDRQSETDRQTVRQSGSA